ncbi:Hypothetical predicted protein [Octopus vulgaris]|uniref:Uncharacterized protein n=1 Tax=Octopus vulgaris TaxID=6645 RepID=A0AA36AJ42_OCTVU|nr:Hypothetical predicted protein [Octopus vulgaris]
MTTGSKMLYKVIIQYLNCFSSVIMFVSSAPHCEVPTNLEARHRIHYGLRNKFISTDKLALQATIQLPLLELDKTCPTSIAKYFGNILTMLYIVYMLINELFHDILLHNDFNVKCNKL